MLSLTVLRSDTGLPLTGAKLQWNATLVGKQVTHSQSYKAGTARLSLLVPTKTRGNLLKLKLTITVSGKTFTRSFAYRVASPPVS